MSGVTLPHRAFGEPRRLAHRGLTGNEWFEALDDTVLAIGPDLHRFSVLGVHLDDRHIWIQFAASDDPGTSFVVCAGDRATLDQVTAALRALPGVPPPLTIVRVQI